MDKKINASQAKLKYINKYNKEYYKRIEIKLNTKMEDDMKVYNFLHSSESAQGTVKKAVLEYIKNHEKD